jgi:hypothetical protein
VRRKPFTYGDLPESCHNGELLLCKVCWEQYSATRGDYWERPSERPVCYRCLEPLKLVRKVVSYVQVRPRP